MEKQFLVNIHKAYRWVIAICDKDLAGQKIEEGERQLDLTGNFFKGEEKTEEELKEIIQDCIREDSTFNIIGEESCRIAEELNLVEKEGVLRIRDIPYALVLL